MKSTDERPGGGQLYYYSMYHLKKCTVMIATWPFSSSKCSPDISQLNVTIPCPVSGCPLEREPQGEGATLSPLATREWGVREGISALAAAVFCWGRTSLFLVPVLSTAGGWGCCTGPGDSATILLLPWHVWCYPSNIIHSRMRLFSPIWTSLNLYVSYSSCWVTVQVEVSSFSQRHKIIGRGVVIVVVADKQLLR